MVAFLLSGSCYRMEEADLVRTRMENPNGSLVA